MTQSKSSKWKSLKLTRYKTCCICGKKFIIKIRVSDSRIMTDCFHGELDLNYFSGWTYRLENIPDDIIFIPIYKNWFYKLVGFSRWSRETYYWIWKLFKRKKIFEFWECVECNNRPDDI